MKIGMLARAEDRGLGILTWEVHRNLCPHQTLVIDMGELARGFPMHLDRYNSSTTTVTPFNDGRIDEDTFRWWAAGLDVLYTAETFYDDRIVGWCREMGIATVLHTMPEFYRPDLDPPDAIWNPTPWRHGTLPGHARVVPVPVALDRFPAPHARTEGPLRALHNAGHRAAMDRNGTSLALSALRFVQQPVEVTVSGQDGRLPTGRPGPRMKVTKRIRGSVSYWDVPIGFDVLIMPRRYGGLCLPVQEALAAGVVPIMPDASPNADWPTVLIPARTSGVIRTPTGDVPLTICDAPHIARAIDQLAGDPDLLAEHRAAAYAWAAGHSWDALRDTWMDALQEVAHALT